MINQHLTPRDTPIEVGQTAPEFTLLDQDRNEVSLKALLERGGDVVLSFVPFAFTAVCGDEMQCFTKDRPRFEAKGSTVVGVNCDSFAANKAWAQRDGIEIPLLADMHRNVCRAYGLYWPEMNVAARGTVVIGPGGAIKWVSARDPSEQVSNDEVLSNVG